MMSVLLDPSARFVASWLGLSARALAVATSNSGATRILYANMAFVSHFVVQAHCAYRTLFGMHGHVSTTATHALTTRWTCRVCAWWNIGVTNIAPRLTADRGRDMMAEDDIVR